MLQLIVLVLGALLAIAGVALVSVPASLIVAGIGTATFADPRAPARVLKELTAWVRRQVDPRLSQIIGGAHD